ncbi:MAG: LLM class flavin-dependent oxidoreductase [Deltaproteobacteria bacterium]|nr:LLM class flavin-dependent oxidoreductase [Deltaproteobacteria bacterium]MBI3387132.1 LLM class flavin-dependent oxidoreductase [Deltaproteobacteria bacterium]
MGRVTVGYQDACVHPLWLSRVNLRLARWMGASAVWLPDHFMSFTPAQVWRPEITPAARVVPSLDALFDPLQLLAVTATRIRGVDVGTSVTESIRRHPMSLAQSFVTLDHISKGRAILGIGNGIRENTEPYGLPYADNVARLEEALTIIRLLWNSGGEPISYDGRFWRLRDAVFRLPLYNGKPPRLFVAAHFPRMLRLAGRFGDGWLPGQKVSAVEYRNRLAVIRSAADKAGRRMDGFSATHTMLVALGESREQVLERAMKSRFCATLTLGVPADVWRAHGLTHPLGDAHRGFLDIVPTRISDVEIDRAVAMMIPELLLTLMYAGSAQQICDEVAPLVDAGCGHFIIANAGASFTGDNVRGLWRLAELMRRLRRL